MRKRLSRVVGAVVIPPLIFMVIKLLWFTYRKRYHYIDAPIDEQCMAVSWHSELLISPQVYRELRKKHKTSAIIAQHYDGELIAKTLSYFNINALRGSSRRGAKSVLINAIKAIKEGDTIMITPDGPRGPRHTMSDGAVALALRSALPLMVVNYQPSSYWQLSSWDRFLIPKPFSYVDIYHQIIYVDKMEKESAKEYLLEKMMKYTLR